MLNLPNGSYAQRVQAEYLKEVEDRGKAVYAAKSGEGGRADEVCLRIYHSPYTSTCHRTSRHASPRACSRDTYTPRIHIITASTFSPLSALRPSSSNPLTQNRPRAIELERLRRLHSRQWTRSVQLVPH